MNSQLPPLTKRKGIADVVFCIDSTGSMGPCIEGVKENVGRLIQGFSADKQSTLDWRVRLVSYRDLRAGEVAEEFAFTDNAEEFVSQIRSIKASGGGDEPESTLDAIMTAAKSDWRPQCNKVVVLLTDASTHPELHPSSVSSGQAKDMDEVINTLAGKGILLHLYGPKCDAYERLAQQSRVMYYQVASGTGLVDSDFGKVMESIGKTVSVTTLGVEA
jgi:hypothetical protein